MPSVLSIFSFNDLEAVALTVIQGAYIALTGVSVTLLAGGFFFRRQLGARGTLACTMALSLAILGALLAGVYLWDGPRIVSEGAGPMGELLPRFEQMIVDADAQPRVSREFRVWVFGDSTHHSRGESRTFMLNALRAELERRGLTDIRIDGVQWPGFNGFEYYFLTNRLLEHPPDLVLMPLNLRAFGPNWYRDGANTYSMTERYCRWEEIPRAARLSSPARRITWPGMLLRKLDWVLFESRGEAYMNGLKLRAEYAMGKEAPRPPNEVPFAEEFANRTLAQREAARAEFARQAEKTYTSRILADHPVIRAHHALDRLAVGHGIGVMYYTVQTPDPRAKQDWNFTTLRWALSADPGVRFIEMTDLLPKKDFEFLEHLYLPGMQKVASRLVDEIVAARDDGKWRASLAERRR